MSKMKDFLITLAIIAGFLTLLCLILFNIDGFDKIKIINLGKWSALILSVNLGCLYMGREEGEE